jgi:hypothetical protein
MRPDDMIILLDTVAVLIFAAILVTLVIHTERDQHIRQARKAKRDRLVERTKRAIRNDRRTK